jgi:seryl-tRNA synthetase
MLDVKLIRESPDAVKEGITKKGVDPELVDEFLALDQEWRRVTAEVDALRGELRQLSEGRKQEEAKKTKEKLKIKQGRESVLSEEREEALHKFPNLPFPDVPVGGESANTVLRTVGEPTHFDFPTKDYLSLAREHDLIDTEKAAATSGSRFGYLKGDAVLLEFALVKLAFDVLTKRGFIPVVPPALIRPEVFRGMGRLAHGEEEERYLIEKDNLYLAGSAEHTMGPLHMNEVLNQEDLPKRYVGFSTCFRREAGSYGKDTKGILRSHQFDKVEMFSFVLSKESEQEHQFLLSLQEELMQTLKLPYRVVELATGDMGWTDARQYDIETWIPSEGRYRETHSASNTTDFQARGINVKYRRKDGNTEFVHMLNATAFAIGRTLIAIMENFETKDGKIHVPKALQAYVGKKIIG